ncbi:TPA: SAM-dependent methyltransferase [Candidatus Uhrbacteria bacterium]|nr:SAM-dependent methyltransferase [Candidatus Uhrbacteria bacterium]
MQSNNSFMSLYSRFILPKILDKSMSDPALKSIRRNLLANAAGNILEIGFGSGVNLPEYPASTKEITAVDTNPGFAKLINKQFASSSIKVNHVVASMENLPFPDATFDTVISTWTLCSVTDVDQALEEIKRVLKPEGKFLFIEHGLNNNKRTAWLQNATNWFSKLRYGGCNLNRQIPAILKRHDLAINEYREFDIAQKELLTRHTYQGIAHKI